MKTAVLTLTVLVSLGFSGRAQPTPNPQAVMLAGAAWNVVDMGFDKDADGVLDASMFKPCHGGRQFTFAADGTGTNYTGAQPCGKKAVATVPFTWTLAGNTMQYTEGAKSEAVTIRALTSSSLTLFFTASKLVLKLARN